MTVKKISMFKFNILRDLQITKDGTLKVMQLILGHF